MIKFIYKRLVHLGLIFTIIGFALKVYTVSKNTWLVVYTFLCVIIYVLFIIIFKLYRDLRLQKITTRDIWKSQDEIYKSLSLALNSDPNFDNNEHRLFLLDITYRKKGIDGYAHINMNGINVSGKLSDCLRIRIAGDSPIDDAKILDIQAKDINLNEDLHVEPIKEFETYNFKPHNIYFKNPLRHNEVFNIEYTYKWPGAFTRFSDYVFYIIHSYTHGVDTFNAKIEFDFKIGLIRIYEVQPDNNPPLSGPIFIPMKRNNSSISFKLDNPRTSLLLQWTPDF